MQQLLTQASHDVHIILPVVPGDSASFILTTRDVIKLIVPGLGKYYQDDR